jgi:hypothetical protein
MLNKLRKGQVTILGKTIPIFLLAILLTAGAASALLTVYITISGTATVSQSVILSGIDSTWQTTATTHKTDDVTGDYSFTIVAGGTQDVGIQLNNRASTNAPVKLRVVGTMPTGGLSGTPVWGTDVVVKLYGDYDPATEQCKTPLIEASVGNNVPVTITGDVPAGLSWLCLEHYFDTAAVPGSYGFTVTLEPA